MIAHLGDEPRDAPAGGGARGCNDALQILAILGRRDFAVRRLTGIGFALMPEQGAEAAGAEGFFSGDNFIKQGAGADPPVGAGGDGVHAGGGRSGHGVAGGQPFAHAGGTDAQGDESDGHLKAGGHGVTEGGQKTAAFAAGSGFGITGRLPMAIQNVIGDDERTFGGLFFFAVIGGIGLAGDQKNFTNADMFHGVGPSHEAGAGEADFEPVPAVGRGGQFTAKAPDPVIKGQGNPGVGGGIADEPRFEPVEIGQGGVALHLELARDEDGAGGLGLPLKHLVIERGGQGDFGRVNGIGLRAGGDQQGAKEEGQQGDQQGFHGRKSSGGRQILPSPDFAFDRGHATRICN